MEGLRGTPVPNGPSSRAGGTESPIQAAVYAYVEPAGDGISPRVGSLTKGTTSTARPAINAH